jgi:hypothetical protein
MVYTLNGRNTETRLIQHFSKQQRSKKKGENPHPSALIAMLGNETIDNQQSKKRAKHLVKLVTTQGVSCALY